MGNLIMIDLAVRSAKNRIIRTARDKLQAGKIITPKRRLSAYYSNISICSQDGLIKREIERIALRARLVIHVERTLCFPASGIAKISEKRKKKAYRVNKGAEKMRSVQHGVFPGGHPSKY